MDPNFNLTAYLEQPPPWQNRPEAIRGIVVSVTLVALACVLSRLYIRMIDLRMPGWDDLFVGLYLATTLTSAVTICLAPSFGLGQHLLFFTPKKLRMFLLLFYIGNSSYISSTAFMKISLLFQYLRIFRDGGRVVRRLCQALIVVIGLWGAAFSFMAWVPCFPVHKYWDIALPGGTCYGFGISTDRTAFVLHTALNMVFDVLVLAIPVPLYFDKSAASRTRAGMLVLLLLGCLVNVFAAWRLALLVLSAKSPVETLFDSTFYAPDTVLLASLEVNLASICASVPIFWPVLRQQVFRILVTKEVVVTTGDRRRSSRRYGYKLDSQADRSPSLRPGDLELVSTAPSTMSTATSAAPSTRHYDDAFIIDQVDPLRMGTSAGVETLVRSDTGKRSKEKKDKKKGKR